MKLFFYPIFNYKDKLVFYSEKMDSEYSGDKEIEINISYICFSR